MKEPKDWRQARGRRRNSKTLNSTARSGGQSDRHRTLLSSYQYSIIYINLAYVSALLEYYTKALNMRKLHPEYPTMTAIHLKHLHWLITVSSIGTRAWLHAISSKATNKSPEITKHLSAILLTTTAACRRPAQRRAPQRGEQTFRCAHGSAHTIHQRK